MEQPKLERNIKLNKEGVLKYLKSNHGKGFLEKQSLMEERLKSLYGRLPEWYSEVVNEAKEILGKNTTTVNR